MAPASQSTQITLQSTCGDRRAFVNDGGPTGERLHRGALRLGLHPPTPPRKCIYCSSSPTPVLENDIRNVCGVYNFTNFAASKCLCLDETKRHVQFLHPISLVTKIQIIIHDGGAAVRTDWNFQQSRHCFYALFNRTVKVHLLVRLN